MLDPLYLATAAEAALLAGRIHLRHFRQPLAIGRKGRIDLVTAADLEAERAIRALIAARFPDHEVLGEELTSGLAAPGARFRWIVDPLDGTTNFAHGLAFFSVSIALEIDGRVELGVVYTPVARELFTAERGAGARLNGVPIRVSTVDALVDAVVCTGFPYTVREERRRQVAVFAEFLEEAQAVRRLGSAALDLCYVACGRFDGYWEERLNAWDLAAGALIVEEAGGRVSGMDGGPFDAYAGHIVAASAPLHPRMLEIIARGRASAPQLTSEGDTPR
ncbi:MAG: inositol monophosphatase family protein [Acidobacteriota bacterium]|nr:MAG: inositol monophosphatase [Acidobacteriota bacterium]